MKPREDLLPGDDRRGPEERAESDATDNVADCDADLIEIVDRLDLLSWGRMPEGVRAGLLDAACAAGDCRGVRVVSRRTLGIASAAMLLLGVGIGWGFAWAGSGDLGGGGVSADRALSIDTTVDTGSDLLADGVEAKPDGGMVRVEVASLVFSRPRPNASRALEPSSWAQIGGRD